MSGEPDLTNPDPVAFLLEWIKWLTSEEMSANDDGRKQGSLVSISFFQYEINDDPQQHYRNWN